MLKETPERITYAQKKLLNLIEQRKLRSWCLENGVTHPSAYRLALGEQALTYKTMAQMCNLISPIEWLFFTDEKLPYEPVLLPPFPFDKPCKYVTEHKKDYKVIEQKYNLEHNQAFNIFVTHRTKPTPIFIRKVCDEVNPIEFFTPSEDALKSVIKFVPERGVKKSITFRIELDNLSWLQSNGVKGYQSKLNNVIRWARENNCPIFEL
ncbi:MAG: hypothetical protein K6C98_02600 [Treponema sp.]|nr:hypothetical protein [Treponema sp.]